MRLLAHSLLGLLLLSPLSVSAQDATPSSPIAKARLLVDAPKVTAGTAITASVQFTMPPHWHIYWQNPGDSGIPTTFEWALPKGIAAGDIAWPAPERCVTRGIIHLGHAGACGFSLCNSDGQ
jgi:DsbC/DsbD-like thiol-disulfide interchange protein